MKSLEDQMSRATSKVFFSGFDSPVYPSCLACPCQLKPHFQRAKDAIVVEG